MKHIMLKVRLRRVMKRNKLAEQIKEQQELLVNLQEQVKRNILMQLIAGEVGAEGGGLM